MQSTLTSDGNNGYDPNKIIGAKKELVTTGGDAASETRDNFEVRSPEAKTLPLPESAQLVKIPIPQSEPPAPKKKKPIGLILAGLGVGAIAASIFGYRYWQYTSTHQSTDNATVAGHIHQISSKIGGTVTDVLVTDNQQVCTVTN